MASSPRRALSALQPDKPQPHSRPRLEGFTQQAREQYYGMDAPSGSEAGERWGDSEEARSSLASEEPPAPRLTASSVGTGNRTLSRTLVTRAQAPPRSSWAHRGGSTGPVPPGWGPRSPAPGAVPPWGERRLPDHAGSGLCLGLRPIALFAAGTTSTTFFTIQKSHTQTAARHTQKRN